MVHLLEAAKKLRVKRGDGRELLAVQLLAAVLEDQQVGEELERKSVINPVQRERPARELVVDDGEGGLVLKEVHAIDLAMELDGVAARGRDGVGGESGILSA